MQILMQSKWTQSQAKGLPGGWGHQKPSALKWPEIKCSQLFSALGIVLCLPCINSLNPPTVWVGASIIPTFQIRKLSYREVRKLPEVTMLVDEKFEPRQSGSRVYTLPIAPLSGVKTRDSQQMFDRRLTVPVKNPCTNHSLQAPENGQKMSSQRKLSHKYFWMLGCNQSAQDTELSKFSFLSHDGETKGSYRGDNNRNWVTAKGWTWEFHPPIGGRGGSLKTVYVQ